VVPAGQLLKNMYATKMTQNICHDHQYITLMEACQFVTGPVCHSPVCHRPSLSQTQFVTVGRLLW